MQWPFVPNLNWTLCSSRRFYIKKELIDKWKFMRIFFQTKSIKLFLMNLVEINWIANVQLGFHFDTEFPLMILNHTNRLRIVGRNQKWLFSKKKKQIQVNLMFFWVINFQSYDLEWKCNKNVWFREKKGLNTYFICVCLYSFTFLSLQSHGFFPKFECYVLNFFIVFNDCFFYSHNSMLFAYLHLSQKKVCIARIVHFRYIVNLQINLVLNATFFGSFWR